MRYPVFVCDDDQMQVNDIVKMIGKAEEILSDEHAIEFDVAFTTTFADAKKFLKDNIYTGGVYLLDIELGKEIGQNNGFDLAYWLILPKNWASPLTFTITSLCGV